MKIEAERCNYNQALRLFSWTLIKIMLRHQTYGKVIITGKLFIVLS